MEKICGSFTASWRAYFEKQRFKKIYYTINNHLDKSVFGTAIIAAKNLNSYN